jgi:GntR family transcriptional regulator
MTSTLFRKPNPTSGVPIYLQLKQQLLHATETGALAPDDPLPSIRALAETLVVNPNTVVRVYRELEQEGVIEVRHGSGAFVARRPGARAREERLRAARRLARDFIAAARRHELEDDELRRVIEAELASQRPTSADKRRESHAIHR